MINRSVSERAAVNGLMLLDKPSGISSNAALSQAKRLLLAKKGGHTGSLDPIATGLLPLCFGKATRIAGIFLDFDKTYEVTIRLGVATDTGDTEGQIISRSPVQASVQDIDKALENFRGRMLQVPPMYSAIKKDGMPLYKLARKNQTVERSPREVMVHNLQVQDFKDDSLSLILTCSKGFYVRSLAMDLGEALACGGHVQALRRVGVGGHSVRDALTLKELEEMGSPEQRRMRLIKTDDALSHLPKFEIPNDQVSLFCQGQGVPLASPGWKGLGRIYGGGEGFLGLGEWDGKANVCPRKILLECSGRDQ